MAGSPGTGYSVSHTDNSKLLLGFSQEILKSQVELSRGQNWFCSKTAFPARHPVVAVIADITVSTDSVAQMNEGKRKFDSKKRNVEVRKGKVETRAPKAKMHVAVTLGQGKCIPRTRLFQTTSKCVMKRKTNYKCRQKGFENVMDMS